MESKLNSGAFEYLMKNALIERYKDEVKTLNKSPDEEFNFADILKKEMQKNEASSQNNIKK